MVTIETKSTKPTSLQGSYSRLSSALAVLFGLLYNHEVVGVTNRPLFLEVAVIREQTVVTVSFEGDENEIEVLSTLVRLIQVNIKSFPGTVKV